MTTIRSSSTGQGGPRAGVKIITKGVPFDEARRAGVLNAAIVAGTRKLLPRIEATVKLKLSTSLAPPEESGRFKRSIVSRVYPNGTGVVKSTDTRKIKTWLERRTRGRQSLGKGAYAFRAGKALAKRENKQGYYEAEIARALNG